MKKLQGLKLIEGSIFWETFRGVEVRSVDITHGTLKSNDIHSYTIQPTFKDHEFMQKIGFSKYCYEAKVETVQQLVDNKVKIITESNELIVEMNEVQLDEWKKFATGFVNFYNVDGTECNKFQQENEDEFNEWFASLGK